MNQLPKQQKSDISKYELTLAEFPLFLLSKKIGAKGINCIEYKDIIKGKDGREIQREWKVSPHGTLGFGTDSTLSTLYELFQIWKNNNFESQYINFESIYNLLKKKGLQANKQSYDRIKRDLNCLIGITIEAKNAFWDNKNKAYIDKAFHLFDDYELYKIESKDQSSLPLAWIKASDILYGSVLNGSLLTANFDRDFFYSLTPIEQRLALYLSKIFRSQSIHKRELLEFARQIPISAKQTKHIKERLKKYSEGLISKKFDLLETFDFEKSADKKTELIVFKRNGLPPKEQFELFGNSTGTPKAPPTKDKTKIQNLVEDIMEVCEDKKSINFYKKVARLMPEQTIYRALGEVKETCNLDKIKKSKGALFTNLIKKYAEEQGIKL